MARIQDGNSNPILDDVISSGSLGALNDAVMLALHGQGIAAFQFRSPTAPVFEVSFEGSVDGVDWQLLTAIKGEDGSTFGVDTVPTAGIFFVACGGLDWVRVRVSTYTSGSITVAAKAGYGAGTVSLTPYAGAVTLSGAVDQGAPAASAQAWPVKVSDGVDDAEVMASAPAGAEKALVVRNIPSGTQAVSGTVAVTPPVPVTDNGGSLTVDSPQLPAALVGGRLDENVGAWLGSTAPTVGQKAMASSVPVALASDQSALPEPTGIMQTGSGSLTALNQAVTFASLNGDANTTFQLTGAWVATVIFEASNDGATWVAIYALQAGVDTIVNTGATANGIFRCTTAGFAQVRARVSAYTSGTVVVTARTSKRTSGVFINFPLPAGSNTIGGVTGNVAHDAADAGNPLGLGAQARTTNPTAVANGDRASLISDKIGRLLVLLGAPRELITQNSITLTTTTETTLVAAGGAGVFNDLSAIIVSNTSGTAVRVDFRDATAGTVRFSLMIAANGGGGIFTPPRPVKQTTANNNWTAQLSGAVTDVRIFAQAEINV